MNSRNIAGDLVYTMSPTTLFNFRGSYSCSRMTTRLPSMRSARRASREFWPGNPWYKPYITDMPLIYYPLGSNQWTRQRRVSVTAKGSYWYQHPHHYSIQRENVAAARIALPEVRRRVPRITSVIGIYPNLMNFNFYAGHDRRKLHLPQYRG